MDAGPNTLAVYLKCYAHLFVEEGREGEIVPTFHISKTLDLDSALDSIPIPHHHTPQWDTLVGYGGTHQTSYGGTPAIGADKP